ncbi:hypothetical protein EKD04_023055 [Chloroflexales bacterium ZM16-3]|nr:hypothetical protein [Chloroflexales bacterium ZM16-3]
MLRVALQIYVALAMALLLTACGAGAQGRLLLLDNTATLDEAALAAPAAPLLARGVTLALVLVEVGDSSGADFAERLAAAGLLRGDQIAPDVIGVYVSLSPRYSELRAGERWSTYLPAPALERIRQDALGPELRAGRTGAAFASTLAAIEGEILSQQGRERVQLNIVIVVFTVIITGILFMSHQDELNRRWKHSAPGRLTAWIWGRTPAGRAEAHRELLRMIAAERGRIETLDQQVRQKLGQLSAPQDLQETFDELTARRAALLQGEEIAELRALRSAYDSWLTDVDDLISTRATKQGRAASARRQLARLRADMQRAEKPTRSQRKGKQPRPISAEDLAQLAALDARMAELEASDAQLTQHWHTAQDRQVWLHQLGTAYRALDAEALELWKTACPEAYAAEEIRLLASLRARTSGSADSSYTPPSPSGDSSSSSDWAGDYGGGGESRAGGDW